MVSGYSDDRKLTSTIEALHEQRLRKPFDAQMLLNRVRSVLDAPEHTLN